ncbi:hypothetical protein HK102_001797 [Quaeritorhiza haematococci]|nr:hypothetical protein HK102_001797 [Quaeritorhiza haematococci]
MALSSFAQDLRRGMASVNPLAHNHVEINVLLQEEKDVIKSCRQLAKEKHEAGHYIDLWGKKEDLDIHDVTAKLCVVIQNFADALKVFADQYEEYRKNIKVIRTHQEALYQLKHKQKSLQDKVKDAAKKQKPVDAIKLELETLDGQILAKEAEFHSLKRRELQSGLHKQFDALLELGAKTTITGTFGKHLADQIPQGTLNPGEQPAVQANPAVTERILGDFIRATKDWQEYTSPSQGVVPPMAGGPPLSTSPQPIEISNAKPDRSPSLHSSNASVYDNRRISIARSENAWAQSSVSPNMGYSNPPGPGDGREADDAVYRRYSGYGNPIQQHPPQPGPPPPQPQQYYDYQYNYTHPPIPSGGSSPQRVTTMGYYEDPWYSSGVPQPPQPQPTLNGVYPPPTYNPDVPYHGAGAGTEGSGSVPVAVQNGGRAGVVNGQGQGHYVATSPPPEDSAIQMRLKALKKLEGS